MVWLIVCTFAGMNKAFKGDFGLDFVVGYYQILRNVRKRVKGLRQGNFWAIALLGYNPEGLRICEVRAIEPDLHKTSILQRFVIAINAGLVVKDGYVYKLTDKGRIAFEALQKESKAKREEFVNRVISDAKKRLEEAA